MFAYYESMSDMIIVYYESMKRDLKIKPIYECRCNGRLQTKRFTRLSHTGLVVELEHLKMKARDGQLFFVSTLLFFFLLSKTV
jgi:hypothetical protein